MVQRLRRRAALNETVTLFSFLALAIPAFAAYSWDISANVTAPWYGVDTGSTSLTAVPAAYPTSNCSYVLQNTGYGSQVVQTFYGGGYSESQYLGTYFAQNGATQPTGNYLQTTFSGGAISLYFNDPSYGLTLLQTQYVSIPAGAAVTTLYNFAGYTSSYLPIYHVGVFVNGAIAIEGSFASNGNLGSAAGMGKCVGQLNIGSSSAVPTAVPSSSISATPFTSHIDLQWPAASDPNGMGVLRYEIWRYDVPSAQYLYRGQTSGLTYSDPVAANQTYSYQLRVVNMFFNPATTTITAQSGTLGGGPYPSTTPDGRRVGVRSTGAYWGAGGENIDVRSGNLNFSIPLVSARSLTGMMVPFNLVYNSQNWRKYSTNPSEVFSTDVSPSGSSGYGFGWRFMAGSILPKWKGSVASYYLFRDASGAEYTLDQNSGNVWSSKESVYVWFDANVNVLYFRNGSWWYMGATAGSGSGDAGTLYPTVMKDTDNNAITVTYGNNSSSGWTNSSGLVLTITDARAPAGYSTYYWTWGGGTMNNNIGSGETAAVTLAPQTVVSPFDSTSLSTQVLSSVTVPNATTTFSYNTSGELTKAVLPKGGYLAYDYGTVAYSNGFQYREVTNRRLSKDGTAGTEKIYAFSHPSSAGTNVQSATQLNDPGGLGQKYWQFSTSGFTEGLATRYEGREGQTTPVAKTRSDFTWTQDVAFNSYISSTTTTMDPGQTYGVAKKTNQTVDIYGNVSQVQQFDYNSLTAAKRTYDYTYLNGSGYLGAYIRNRLSTAKITEGGVQQTLVTNYYDGSNQYVTYSGGPGRLANSTPLGDTPTLASYTSAGQVFQISKSGVTTQMSYANSPNQAAPSQITVGSLTENMTYNSYLALTNESGPNGVSVNFSYDPSARPATAQSAYGAYSFITYTNNTTRAVIGSDPPPNPPQNPPPMPHNGRFTKTTVDGLGRTIKVETGTLASDAETVVSVVETAYDSCGCSPTGKLKQTSLPHAPNASATWTTYNYDGIGRTLSAVAPDGSTTSYLYQGNMVTLTDAANKTKKYTSDAFGRLTQVNEPNPAGGADYVTTYSYDMLDHLTSASMPRPSGTQTRTFNYGNPPTPQLQSATNPENGTVSYTYDSNYRLSTVTDAKNQRKIMTYDSLGRVTQISRGTVSGGTFTEDPLQRTNYYYDTNPFNGSYSATTQGRLAAVQYCMGASGTCQPVQEWYDYSTPGDLGRKKVVLNQTGGGAMTGSLEASVPRDNEGKVTGVSYPSWQGCSGCAVVAGSSYTFGYDTLARLSTMTDATNGNTALVSGISYGVANQILQMTSASAAVNSETRSYNSLLQLTGLQVGSVLNKTYVYPAAGSNNGKLVSETDVLSGEQVGYTYDALNRLATAQTIQVSGTQWGQSYTYDGFGNLTDQNVIKGSAPTMHVAYNAATNRQTGDTADANGNIGSGNVFDVENRLVQPAGTTMGYYSGYYYDAGNKRISTLGLTEFTFWLGTQKLATYSISNDYYTTLFFTLKTTNVYFGGKLVSKGTYSSLCTCSDKVVLAPVAGDRLGSIGKFYPYGQERPSATVNDTEKFTGYFRDAATGLDYADQRYHQPGVGRFMTADPYSGSARASDPGSWNRYTYVRGDPINRVDPTGERDPPIIIPWWIPPGRYDSVTVFGGGLFFGGFDVPELLLMATLGLEVDPSTDFVDAPLPSSGNQFAGFSNALDALKNKPGCASLIAGSSGMTADQLVAALNKAGQGTSIGTTQPGNGPVRISPNPNGTYNYSYQWGYTSGGNIELNGNYFPDPTKQNIQIPGGTTSFLQLVNMALGGQLDVTQLGTLVFLHELSHIAIPTGQNAATIDTNEYNQSIVSTCIN